MMDIAMKKQCFFIFASVIIMQSISAQEIDTAKVREIIGIRTHFFF